MKRPVEADLKIVYGWLVDNPHYTYSKFINVRPVNPPYSPILRPHRFYLRTRRWWKDRKDDVVIHLKNWEGGYGTWMTLADFNAMQGGVFVDVITLTERINYNLVQFEYWMWISNDKAFIKIFKSEDWCNLNEIIADSYCKCWVDYFVPIVFLKGKPRNLYKDPSNAPESVDWSYVYWHWGKQQNYTFYQQRASLADLQDNSIDWTAVRWNFNGIWPDTLRVWDYLYTYGITQWYSSWIDGICGQVNTITWLNPQDSSKLMVSNYWNWFEPWQIDPTKWADVNNYYSLYGTIDWLDNSYYVSGREPQTEWNNMDYIVLPEYGETFAYQTINGMYVYHYHHYTDFNNEAITTPFCNFNSCYSDWVMYAGRNWISHQVYLDWQRDAILYSDWGNLWYLWAGNTMAVRHNTLWLTTFQNYVIYFWQQHIWAFWIDVTQDKLTGINRYIATGNIIRNNLWFWTNPDGRVTAYDEYDNSFYFLWSNKRLYALSILPTETGLLTSQLIDMTEDDWAKWIIWDLENLHKSDFVYIQADDDRFRIFINGSSNNWPKPHKTKILTYWKRYKFWTTDISCDTVVKKEKQGNCSTILLWNSVYQECGHLDWNWLPVEYMIEAHIGEDEVSKIEGNHSFNLKYLDYIKTQIGKHSKKVEWDSYLQIYSYKDWTQFKKIIWWLWDTAYLSALDEINNWWNPTPTECMIQSLNDCEWLVEDCKGWNAWINDIDFFNTNKTIDWRYNPCNGYSIAQCYNACNCPPEYQQDDYCFCLDDKKYYLSPFVNLLSSINMKWEMFTIQLRGKDDIWFWGFFMWVYNGTSPKDVLDCNKWNCEDCTKHKITTTNTWTCF